MRRFIKDYSLDVEGIVYYRRHMQELLSWGIVVGVIFALVGLGFAALQVVSSTNEFWIARGCYTLAAIAAIGRITFWGITTPHSLKFRLFICFLVFGAVGALLVTGIRYVNSKSDLWIKSHQTPTTTTSQKAVESKEETKPKTLHDFFRTDFSSASFWFKYNIGIEERATKTKHTITIEIRLVVDFHAKSEFIAFYIPQTPKDRKDTFGICKHLATNYHIAFSCKDMVYVEGGIYDEDPTTIKELVFTRRIYIYHEALLMKEETEQLERLYKENELSLILRSPSYAFDKQYRTYTLPAAAQDSSESSS